MAYKTKFDGSTDKTIQLGGKKADGTPNPTSLEGYFLGSKDTQSDYGPGKLHVFQTKDGTVGVWGKSRLDNLLTSELVGQMTLVTFTGMIESSKKGRRPSYGYRVQHDEDDKTNVSGLDLNAAPASTSESDEESSDYGDTNSSGQDDNESFDEVAPVRASPPKVAASIPAASRVQALLKARKA